MIKKLLSFYQATCWNDAFICAKNFLNIHDLRNILKPKNRITSPLCTPGLQKTKRNRNILVCACSVTDKMLTSLRLL